LNDRIGNISFYDSQGRDSFTKPYSDETARVIDEEVSKLIEFQYQRALTILEENKDKLAQLADKLLATEVIFKEDLIEIFGKRIWDKEEEEIVKVVSDDLSSEETSEIPTEIASEEPEVNPEIETKTEDLPE
jgi:cell division protease FtsH